MARPWSCSGWGDGYSPEAGRRTLALACARLNVRRSTGHAALLQCVRGTDHYIARASASCQQPLLGVTLSANGFLRARTHGPDLRSVKQYLQASEMRA